ncbi:MAG TPA: cytochrome P450 [Acidimicrobiales bacterium]|nr:cytochrome P450 [Acidimicrobiales bacterium]
MTRTFNPFDPDQAHDSWHLLADLRRERAVVDIGDEMAYVTRHAECRHLLRDTENFSSARGFKAPGVIVPVEDRTLGELDPPNHTLVRRAMVTALTPRSVKAAEPYIRSTANALLETLPDEGEVDLVPRFTGPLPNASTVHLLGFPEEDAPQIMAWAKDLMESGFPGTHRNRQGVEGFREGFPAFAGYIDDRIEERRRRPRDDVTTRLLELEIDGERLTARQLRAMVRNLITGGLTTTSQLLGNLLYELFTVPGLEDRLRAEPESRPRAIEESLRLAPPIMFIPRSCARDVEVDGTLLHAEQRVIVGTGCANRDEATFADGDDFDIDRGNLADHLTFGYGPHFCPGAPLARAVARIGITAILDRFPPGTIRLTDGFVYENVPAFFETGPEHLTVRTARRP